ncbi:putative MFS family arabinose efflux permease [Nocardiopsis mwathae]|uniref:Putative MFS family arabinose efflux permease n=1 Tax=Nocardiopsis mwathae TaxID=1472723 RepID=A0A7W9YJ45_9ACTN|nr:MFS transporter [Nocardiopsis mwathae]MBB6173039.1 putative MFS family arabinose efflux permease [Nocardiopsis mwathae]
MTLLPDERVPITAPLRYRNFRALAAGRTLMYFGNGVATVALAFAVLDATGSLIHLGLVVGARSVANVVLLLVGGVLADRFPRDLILRGGCAVAAVSQGLLAASVLLGFASLPVMIALSVVNGAAAAANLPAAAALTPQTVPASLLRPANALVRIGLHMGMFVGMSTAAGLAGLVESGWALAVNALVFVLAALGFLLLRLPSKDGRADERSDVLRDLRDGWHEVASRPWVWVVVLQFMVVNATWSGTVAVLGPAIADASFGRTTWGLVLAANSIGMLVGGVLAARRQPRRALGFGVALAAVEALPMAVLGTGAGIPFLFTAMFLAGMAVEQFCVAWEVSIQQNIPADRLSRVYSYDALGSFAAMPLGEIAVGPIAKAVGMEATLLGMGSLLLLATAGALGSRSVRTLRVR